MRSTPRGHLQHDGGARAGRREQPGVAADVAEAGDDRLLEAELRLVDVVDVEADAGVGDHRAHHRARRR